MRALLLGRRGAIRTRVCWTRRSAPGIMAAGCAPSLLPDTHRRTPRSRAAHPASNPVPPSWADCCLPCWPRRCGRMCAADAARLGLLSVPAADLIGLSGRPPRPDCARSHRRACRWRMLPTPRVIAFRTEGSAIEHLAIVVGHPETADAPLVRIHSECFTGDLLGSLRCDCGTAAARRDCPDGRGGRGCAALSRPGRAQYRPGQQAASLHAAGSRARHAGRESGAGLGGGRTQLPDRRHDAGGARHQSHPAADQQSRQAGGAGRLRRWR